MYAIFDLNVSEDFNQLKKKQSKQYENNLEIIF